MRSFKWLSFMLVVVMIVSFFTVGAVAENKIKFQIIDVAGAKQLLWDAVLAFQKANPNVEIELIKGTAPELPSKIRAQQMAGNVETCMVWTGYDAMGSGIVSGIYEKILPKNKESLPDLDALYLPGTKAAQDLFQGYGVALVFCPGGPMFTYNPEKVTKVPKTAAALLAWCKANPGKFLYARPANSGPGRAFLQGLPYILGDKNPKDPRTWTKTWAYLKELDKYIDYYPTGTGITFRELGEKTRWIIASHLGWDLNQRILATIPTNFQGFFLKKTTWVTDTQFAAIPKGLDAEHKKVALQLISWLLKPESQAVTYDDGYFYPGPAIKNVPLAMAPKASQDKVGAAMRPAYDKAIEDFPKTTQLDAWALTLACDMWDQLVGSKIK